MDKLKAASLSIAVNAVLALAKLGVGLSTNSLGIIAEFLHSLFDLLASVFAYFGIRKAMEPADSDHPYGHDKYENLSALLQTLLILLTALWVGFEAAQRFLNPAPIESTWLGIAVMGGALAVDFFFARFLHGVSRREGSVALESDAYHFTSDLWSTSAVLAGLALAALGFPQGDSVAAFAVAVMMLKLSVELGGKALGVLLDKGAQQEELERISAVISQIGGVKGYHRLRARHMGSRLVVDVHIHVDGSMPLSEAHAIAHRLKGRVTKEFPHVKEILVHVEPSEEQAR
jgi:cation diffusion facilitator family transporter